MLTFRSVREAYVAKGTARESKTWVTMSLIIWSITDCSEPITPILFSFLDGSCETLSSYEYSHHSISTLCQSRQLITAINQLNPVKAHFSVVYWKRAKVTI